MAQENNDILELDLSEQDEKLLRETLESWKEEVYSDMLEEVEQLKEQKIEELEEANVEYREELKQDYSDKMMKALKEMREEIKAEVLSETVSSNPELQVFEQIKELVAPTLDEEYSENVYAEELQTLREENDRLKEEQNLEEGAKALADLIAPYSERTQNILLSVIQEGGPEEVTEQFYDLIESMELTEADDEDDEEDDFDVDDEEEDDDEEDEEKPRREDYDTEEEYQQALKDYEDSEDDDEEDDDEEDDDEEDDDEEDDDEEYGESEQYRGSYIKESTRGRDKKKSSENPFMSRVRELVE